MPQTRHFTATCGHCGVETAVTEVYWPPTRIGPPDGENSPEECSGCGRGWDDETAWADAEPPDPW